MQFTATSSVTGQSGRRAYCRLIGYPEAYRRNAGLSFALHELAVSTKEQADNTDRLREELKEAGKQLRDLGNEIAKARP